MTTAIVDTTVLTDVLLKSGAQARDAKEALASFERTELPVYAIKEFKSGPLRHFIWVHNKLVTTKSYQSTLGAVHAISRTPQRYFTSTAIEALGEAAGSIQKDTLLDLEKKYGKAARPDEVLADTYRLSLKARILRAWRRRRKVTGDVTYPLSCYGEIDPVVLQDGTIEKGRLACMQNANCDLAKYLKEKKTQTYQVRETLKTLPEKRERTRSKKALRDALRKSYVPEKTCRNLGDAVFSVLCPDGGTVLTTNIRDHRPLAEAIGKRAFSPSEVVARHKMDSKK